MDAAYGFFVFIFGIMIGSFLNVCIHRMPQDQSIVQPGSHCPGCNKAIAWHDNIPLVSYLTLRGKCRHCGAGISPRYFIVELLNGIVWLFLWMHFGLTGLFYAGAVFFSILLALIFTDIETGLIPDKLSLPGIVIGLAASAIWPALQDESIWYWGLLHSFFGVLAGGGVLIAIAYLGMWMFKKEAMGGGDIKLLAMIGAFVGAKKVLLIFLFSPLLALPLALYLKLAKKSEFLAYGPYLALTAAAFYLYGDRIVSYFINF